jgi:N-acyl amino acid synthase of PEP-CTERM/exosortase system
MRNLGEGFETYFQVVPALTPELKEEVFRIRHEVFCEELRFEPVHPDGRETDEYDAHSLHCLLRNIHDGVFAGCARLILTRPEDPQHPLPFEKTCKATIDRSIADPQRFPRDKIGEVSRLAIIAKYRRRKGEKRNVGGFSDHCFGDEKRPRFPYIPVGLYLGIIALALRHGVDTIFVLTDPHLAAHFRKLGVEVKQIGGGVEHRGVRVPSMMDCKSIVAGLNLLTRPLYKAIAAEIDQGIRRQKAAKTEL